MYPLRAFAKDPNATDEIWGFHAQQATEKMLKAGLAAREISFPFTHRLTMLADLWADNGIQLPEEFLPLLDLTQYAAELRYTVLPPDEGRARLDRVGLIRLLEQLRDLVAKRL
jgi:HEPN domain-containing protein